METEEKIFSSAINETDYLRKISMKMLTMETKSQNAVGASSTIPAANNGTSLDSTPINQGHLLTGSLPTNQSQASQPLLSQPMQTSLDSTAQTESANGGDWQEEVFQKIKSMKETYLPNLTEMYQRVGAKLQQLESLPQQQRSEQFEKLKQYKTMLERMMQFLSVSKSNIMPPLKDKVAFYEKQIVTYLKMYGPRTGVQQGQLPQSQMQPMQQTQSQTVQDQSHDNQTNPQIQSMNMQGTGPRAQQSSLPNNNVLSSRPGVSASQQNIPSPIPASGLESKCQSNSC